MTTCVIECVCLACCYEVATLKASQPTEPPGVSWC